MIFIESQNKLCNVLFVSNLRNVSRSNTYEVDRLEALFLLPRETSLQK